MSSLPSPDRKTKKGRLPASLADKRLSTVGGVVLVGASLPV